MATRPNFVPPNVKGRHILRSRKGEVVLEISYENYMISLPDGRIEQHTINNVIETVDGMMWSPMARRGKNREHIAVGICEACRAPRSHGLRREEPTHGIVTLANAEFCCKCGRLCCPRHRKRCSDDQTRCLPCASIFRIKRFFSAIFFVNAEE